MFYSACSHALESKCLKVQLFTSKRTKIEVEHQPRFKKKFLLIVLCPKSTTGKGLEVPFWVSIPHKIKQFPEPKAVVILNWKFCHSSWYKMKWFFSTKENIGQKPSIKHRLIIPFHKGLVILDVYFMVSLKSRPKTTPKLTFNKSVSLHKWGIVDNSAHDLSLPDALKFYFFDNYIKNQW